MNKAFAFALQHDLPVSNLEGLSLGEKEILGIAEKIRKNKGSGNTMMGELLSRPRAERRILLNVYLSAVSGETSESEYLVREGLTREELLR